MSQRAGRGGTSWSRRLMGAMVAAVVGSVGLAPVASAANGGSPTGGGYEVTAQLRFSGDAAPGGGGTVAVRVPATCWWSSDDVTPNPDDPVAVKAHWLATMPTINGSFSFAREFYGTVEMYDAAIAAAAAGQKLTYYKAQCRTDAEGCPISTFVKSVYPAGFPYVGAGCPGIPISYAFFPTGAPPEPRIAPEDLARAARDAIVIPEPVLDRNPVVPALGGSTLVGLPTWFWVTDPDAVGGAAGRRTIRAEVGGVFAELTARTDGLVITSPAGGVTCTTAEAMTAYSGQDSDDGACSFSFVRASVGYGGGYPVAASTAWTATWIGSGGTGGDLEGLVRTSDLQVPVAESQALVTGSG